MANTQSLSNQLRSNILTTGFNLSTKALKAAIFFTSATINATTAAYSVTGEATGTGYTAGGVAVTNGVAVSGANTTITGDTYFWTPSAAITWTTVSITNFDTIEIYDSVTPFHLVGAWNIGNQTVTLGNITINMPVNNSTTALVRLL